MEKYIYDENNGLWYMIEPKMTELISKNEGREQSIHIIERIARFHLEFEGIHPFIDGNGRTGRLLMNLDLIRNGFPPINVKFTDRKRYYDAFDAYYKEDDAIPMIELIWNSLTNTKMRRKN